MSNSKAKKGKRKDFKAFVKHETHVSSSSSDEDFSRAGSFLTQNSNFKGN